MSFIPDDSHLCRLECSRGELVCYRVEENDVSIFKTVAVPFNISCSDCDQSDSIILKIMKDHCILVYNTNLLMVALQNDWTVTLTLPHPVILMVEYYQSILVIYKTAALGSGYGIIQEDINTGELSLLQSVFTFTNSDSLFHQARSRITSFEDYYGEIWLVYVTDSGQLMLTFTPLDFGSSYDIVIPKSKCPKVENIFSTKSARIILECSKGVVLYDPNTGEWSDLIHMYPPRRSACTSLELYENTSPTIFATVKPAKSTNDPDIIVFIKPHGNSFLTSYASVPKGQFKEGVFTQKGGIFCFHDNQSKRLICYNATAMFEENTNTESSASFYHATFVGDIEIIGSLGSRVLYSFFDEARNETVVDVLPKLPKEDFNKVTIDRTHLCNELKEVLPTLWKLFCRYK